MILEASCQQWSSGGNLPWAPASLETLPLMIGLPSIARFAAGLLSSSTPVFQGIPTCHILLRNVSYLSFWSSKARSQPCLVVGEEGGICLAGTDFCVNYTYSEARRTRGSERGTGVEAQGSECYVLLPTRRNLEVRMGSQPKEQASSPNMPPHTVIFMCLLQAYMKSGLNVSTSSPWRC